MMNEKTFDEIKAKPLGQRTVTEEIELAKHEHRQPRCPYCEELLEVREIQDVDLFWHWDKKNKKYIKSEGDGSSSKPECANCETKDWDFTNNSLVAY
jgi:hypothetical protein